MTRRPPPSGAVAPRSARPHAGPAWRSPALAGRVDGVRLRAVRLAPHCRSSRWRSCSGSGIARRARATRRGSASRSALGLFGAGVSWVYIALQTFGGMPAPLAAVATAGLVAFLSLYPALAGLDRASRWTARDVVGARCSPPRARSCSPNGCAATCSPASRGSPPAIRSCPSSPLAGFAPIGGVWLVSLAVALVRRVARARGRRDRDRPMARRRWLRGRRSGRSPADGAALRGIEWTTPSGAPLAGVARAGQRRAGPQVRRRRSASRRSRSTRRSRETSPRAPRSCSRSRRFRCSPTRFRADVVADLANIARARGGELLFGVFVVEAPAPGKRRAADLQQRRVASARERTGLYRKRHLVPFGETIPAKPLVGWVMRNLLAIPIGDQARGPDDQAPFRGRRPRRIAVNICYEDAFGDELRARRATRRCSST